jgi:hypothetical protein
MLCELCEIIIGNNSKGFQETLKRNKVSRRNLLRFMAKTGKFFSLQSVLESFNMMQRKGISL